MAPQVLPRAPASATRSLESIGLDGSALDRAADPCTDFYQFACGGWLAKTEIPADEARWSRSFTEIEKRNEEELRRILDSAQGKLGAYYASCMDEAAVEKAGLGAIEPLRRGARAITDARSLGAFVAELHQNRIWALFDISDRPDYKDTSRVVVELDQNGLGLPDRDFYVRADEKSKEILGKYAAHVERMMALAGYAPRDARRAAEDVVHLETELAKISKTRVERRNPHGLDNRVDRDGLVKLAPELPWAVYFGRLGFPELRDINVTSVPFFEGLNRLMTTTRPAVWKSYLDWTILRSTASLLPKRFTEERFALEQVLNGTPTEKARWKRCVDSTDHALGELLGEAFVARRFGKAGKDAAESMVNAIRETFATELRGLDWMDPRTKERAFAKLEAITFQIGYPNRYRVYDFDVAPTTYAANALAASRFETKRQLTKVGKPLDRDDWGMTPPTVNAYASANKRLMVFPAGILQPPFFSADASTPVNLGAIGMVIGHELTHHFDDKGSKFDAKGNLANWWEPGVKEKFEAKAACVSHQYSQYEVLPGVHLIGDLTNGENIADIGGVKLALHAYRKMRAGAPEVTVADGFNEDQQFFLAFGQAWCTKARDELLRTRAQTDTHSAPKFRVNGSLSDTPEFAEAFKCAPGSAMRPASSCVVW